jgi:hypothetical protein
VTEITLSADGERAMREANGFCWRANVAIVAPEHLLAGALLVLAEGGTPGLPDADTLREALLMVVGSGDTPLDTQVMYGSAAREAMNATARAVREAGEAVIDARVIALGTIDSGEVSPGFYTALHTTKAALRTILSAPQ